MSRLASSETGIEAIGLEDDGGSDLPLMTVSHFHECIEAGDEFTIVNDFVVDLAGFAPRHPGSSAVITRSIGKDITEYFFGEARMDKRLALHQHSDYAWALLADLAIASLVPDEDAVERGGEAAGKPEGEPVNSESKASPTSKPSGFEGGSRADRVSRNSIASGRSSPSKKQRRVSLQGSKKPKERRSSWLLIHEALKDGDL